MRIKAICKECGNPYWKTNGKSMYCSKECGRKAHSRKQKEWFAEHPAYLHEYRIEHSDAREQFLQRHPNYDRDRSRRLRGSQEYTKECVICGSTFTTWRPNKITCSEGCKERYAKVRDAGRKRGRTKQRDPKKEHERYVKRTYGSQEAYERYLADQARKKAEAKAQKKREPLNDICVVCGTPFATMNPAQKTCSKVCGNKLRYSRKEKRIPKNQIVDKDITLKALYRRDSGVCYLCGGLCDWDDKTEKCVGGNYPSIDHIIPISRGGLHAWNNVRLAHFLCNVKKSNDMLPEAESFVPEDAYSVKREPIDQKKKVSQHSIDGAFVAEYESTGAAEREMGIKQRGIQNCARGECKSYRGYVWAYV